MLGLDILGEVAELTEVEVADPPKPLPAPLIKKLRDTHHALARMLAQGSSDLHAGYACGYTPQRVRQLKQDPTFQELLAHYSRTTEDANFDMVNRFERITRKFMDVIEDRLDEAPDTVDMPLAVDGAKVFADRAGYAPITRSINANVKVGIGDKLDHMNRKRRENG